MSETFGILREDFDIDRRRRIYKPKYTDDISKTPEKEKKQRSDITKMDEAKEKPARSRARSIWGRKKDKPV